MKHRLIKTLRIANENIYMDGGRNGSKSRMEPYFTLISGRLIVKQPSWKTVT
jgi:hypothetical protein